VPIGARPRPRRCSGRILDTKGLCRRAPAASRLPQATSSTVKTPLDLSCSQIDSRASSGEFLFEANSPQLATLSTGTIARRHASCKPSSDNGTGATDICIHRYCACRTIESTCAALDAMVFIDDLRFAILYGEYPVRTDYGAYAASDTFIFVQFERYKVFQIGMFHDGLLSDQAVYQHHNCSKHNRNEDQRNRPTHFFCNPGKRGIG
jgi:hypothetical protein